MPLTVTKSHSSLSTWISSLGVCSKRPQKAFDSRHGRRKMIGVARCNSLLSLDSDALKTLWQTCMQQNAFSELYTEQMPEILVH